MLKTFHRKMAKYIIFRSNWLKIGQKLGCMCHRGRQYSCAVVDTTPDQLKANQSTKPVRLRTAGKFPPERSTDILLNGTLESEGRGGTSNTKNVQIEQPSDFFGFDEVAADTDTVVASAKGALEKYSHLFFREPDKRHERVHTASFGNVRYDKDNPALYRSSNETVAVEPESGSYIDEQYFSEYQVGAEQASRLVRENEIEQTSDPTENRRPSAPDSGFFEETEKIGVTDETENYINEQYFGSYKGFSKLTSENVDRENTGLEVDAVSPKPEMKNSLNFIDEQYFGTYLTGAQSVSPQLDRTEREIQKLRSEEIDPAQNHQKNSDFRETREPPIAKPNSGERGSTKFERTETVSDNFQEKSRDNFGEATSEPTTRNAEKYKQRLVGVNLDQPKTAYDYVMKQRLQQREATSAAEANDRKPTAGGATSTSSSGKVDSRGFNVLSDQTRDLEQEPEMIVLQILKESILYDENEIVALSKPYGLVCHGGAGHRHHVDKYLPELAKYVSRDGRTPCEQLHLVHRLDRDTTGVLLLAKTPRMAQLLHSLLARRRIQKVYWALTKYVPNPPEGVIDIPMAEAMVEGSARMVLRPVLDGDDTRSVIKKSATRSHRAITAYRVLNSEGHAALVELRPQTGVRHQIRVHLAYGLGCPVLGDHKYSHLSVGAPQRLPSDVLQRLGTRQSKVRHLAMHLHARGVTIPEVLDGRDIIIGARLPSHFAKNMNTLNIRSPK